LIQNSSSEQIFVAVHDLTTKEIEEVMLLISVSLACILRQQLVQLPLLKIYAKNP